MAGQRCAILLTRVRQKSTEEERGGVTKDIGGKRGADALVRAGPPVRLRERSKRDRPTA